MLRKKTNHRKFIFEGECLIDCQEITIDKISKLIEDALYLDCYDMIVGIEEVEK